jgi:hypothetical protein
MFHVNLFYECKDKGKGLLKKDLFYPFRPFPCTANPTRETDKSSYRVTDKPSGTPFVIPSNE